MCHRAVSRRVVRACSPCTPQNAVARPTTSVWEMPLLAKLRRPVDPSNSPKCGRRPSRNVVAAERASRPCRELGLSCRHQHAWKVLPLRHPRHTLDFGLGARRSPKYGAHHERLRKQWAPIVAAGLCACARCGRRIEPGTRWELGHKGHGGPADYSGPEHFSCNRQTATHRADAKRAEERVYSREWRLGPTARRRSRNPTAA
jgi:hypothetical protein